MTELKQKVKRYESGTYGLDQAIKELEDTKDQLNIRDRQIQDLIEQFNILENAHQDLQIENKELRCSQLNHSQNQFHYSRWNYKRI